MPPLGFIIVSYGMYLAPPQPPGAHLIITETSSDIITEDGNLVITEV